MKNKISLHIVILLVFGVFLSKTANSQVDANEANVPFRVEDLFHSSAPNTLGLNFVDNVETYTIFAPDSTQNKYNNGVVLYHFNGMLYAQWQSSKTDEDAPDTHVYYSKSKNGEKWCTPIELTAVDSSEITTSGGWWSYNDTLVAFINVWPTNLTPKSGYTEYMISTDGIHWSQRKPVLTINNKPIKGIIEQDIHQYKNNRLVTAFHMQPGLIVTPFYTDNPMGISGWKTGVMQNLPSKKEDVSREIEPSSFARADGNIVMIFRDQQSSFKKIASISSDNAETWTFPQIINTPDSRAKQSAGNLPDGTAFMVNNPTGSKCRYPLVITLSNDGFNFDKAFLIRSGGDDLQPLRYEGKYKRQGYNYPKSIVYNNYLYVGYATNKEDVEISKIKNTSLNK